MFLWLFSPVILGGRTTQEHTGHRRTQEVGLFHSPLCTVGTNRGQRKGRGIAHARPEFLLCTEQADTRELLDAFHLALGGHLSH